jgi:thioredoxin reductase (NADPH)
MFGIMGSGYALRGKKVPDWYGAKGANGAKGAKAPGEHSMANDTDVAFPVLSGRDLDRLVARGHPRAVKVGDILFAQGDRDFCFYIVLEGAVEIVEHSSGEEKIVTTHRAGQFTGDIDTLTGRVALVTARVAEPGRVQMLSTAELRKAVDELPEVGEVIVKAFLMRRRMLVEGGFVGVTIIGSRFSPASHRLRDFAVRNLIPIHWRDLDTDVQAEEMLRQLGVPASDTPIVIGINGAIKRNPTLEQFARCAGLVVTLEADHVYDLVVVGAGPAGLAASVYAASEGLDVLTADTVAAGGQAGTSARIENYLGFPTGISGRELTQNALIQAQRFGAQITVPCTVRSLGLEGGDRVVTLADNTRIRTRCVLVASGVQYRQLDVPRFVDFDGAGIYYAATEMEAKMCGGEEVVVVGAGNSAGQAVVNLSRHARHVHLVVRGSDLGASMSRYLVDRIEAMDNVSIHLDTNVTALDGNGHLASLTTRDRAGNEALIDTSALFLFIGADPNTSWLRGCVELDKRGFVLTGIQLAPETKAGERWRAIDRMPFLLETSLPGVFAAGDVRSGSVKRVASAVGDGAMAVSFVHAHIGARV